MNTKADLTEKHTKTLEKTLKMQVEIERKTLEKHFKNARKTLHQNAMSMEV